jgi:hypothetical protein
MRRSVRRATAEVVLARATAMVLAAPMAFAAEAGAVQQTVPLAVSQNAKPPPLQLSDDQRGRIRDALRDVNSEVDFALKSNKPAQSFTPSVGAKIPAGLHPHTLPPPLIYEMPALKRYTYLKFKQQVLIIDPMSRKVIDMFPEASG